MSSEASNKGDRVRRSSPTLGALQEMYRMIESLKYYAGTGLESGAMYPKDLSAAVSVGASSLTKRMTDSFEDERIAELSGTYGTDAAADPVEVDRLEVKTDRDEISITVLNRGMTLLMTENEEVRRLHRFFCILRDELA